jgi:hypothetical protein
MHRVDATTDSEWNSLVTSKPKGCITDMTQQFMVEASLLSINWQEKVIDFQGVRKRALELVPEFFPSFEEVKKERTQEKIGSKAETKDKGKKQANLETTEEPMI